MNVQGTSCEQGVLKAGSHDWETPSEASRTTTSNASSNTRHIASFA